MEIMAHRKLYLTGISFFESYFESRTFQPLIFVKIAMSLKIQHKYDATIV